MRTTLNSVWCSLLIELTKVSVYGIAILLSLILLLGSCTASDGKSKEGDRLVAKVFNKSLFQSELQELIGEDTNPEDSMQIANAYIEKWVRDAVLMHEAEKYVPKDLNIDELVRDYRASLIRHNYEKLLVETSLDSTINETELDAYYQENKEQYKLESPILKCHFVKIPKPVENWTDVKDWWKSEDEEDYKRLIDYCSRNAEVYMLDENIWYYLEEISQHLPKGKLTTGNYRANKKISTNDEEYEYLLKVFDATASGEYAPLAFIQEQATKVILHKRKIALLEQKKEEMYERESGSVEVFLEE